MPEWLDQLQWMCLSGLLILVVFGIPALFILRNISNKKLCAEPTPRPAYDGRIVIAGLVFYLMIPDFLDPIWNATGIYGRLFERHGESPDTFKSWRLVASRVFSFPFQLGVLLYSIRLATPRSQPLWVKPALNYARGYVVWVVAVPFVFVVYVLANFLTGLTGAEAQKHPLTALASKPNILEWVFLTLQVTVIAPILEEVAFRGLLFSWVLANRPKQDNSPLAVPLSMRPWLVLLLAVGLCFMVRSTDLSKAAQGGDTKEILLQLIPICVALMILPLGLFYPKSRFLILKQRQDWLTILATASFFGFLHVAVWPTPIPLLVLGLFLGYARLRSNSLTAPIVAHALFNSISLLYLMIGGKP